MLAGPVTNAISKIADYFGGNLIVPLSGGLSPSSSSWLVDQSVWFQVVAILILLAKFMSDVVKENKTRKADDKIVGLVAALTHLGPRLLFVPLIALASAIPGFFGRSMVSVYPATVTTAKKMAGLADGVLDQLGNFWSMTVEGEAGRVLGMSDADGAKLSQQQRDATLAMQKTYGEALTDMNASRQAYQSALASGVPGTALQAAKARMDSAQRQFASVNAALTNFTRQTVSQLDTADAGHAKSLLTMLRIVKDSSLGKALGPMISLGLEAPVRFSEAQLENRAKQSLGWTDVPRILLDFFAHLGFYACCLPALLGLIAGAVMVFKESAGLLMYGAKIDIMRGLGLTFAAFFAPLFMLSFLFPKTEQFGWKFIGFLFSMVLGVTGAAYVCGVVANVGMGAIGDLVYSLTAVPTGYLPKEASQALFMASLEIGIGAIGVGLMVHFAGDILKAGLKVGQGPFTGSFNV